MYVYKQASFQKIDYQRKVFICLVMQMFVFIFTTFYRQKLKTSDL